MSDTPESTPQSDTPESTSQLTAGQNLRYGMPLSTEWGAVDVGGTKMLVLRIEDATGTHYVPLPVEMAEQVYSTGVRLARKIQGKPTGDLTVATPADVRQLGSLGPVIRRSNGTSL